MLSQATHLKSVLKKLGLSARHGHLSVTTERLYVGKSADGKSLYEYGRAVSHLTSLTDEQIDLLKGESEYIEIYNNTDLDFSIVKY